MVSTVDHTKGPEVAGSGAATEDVRKDIVHENADDQAPSVMQKATEAVAQGVQKAKDAVVGKADHSAPADPTAPAPVSNHQSHV